MRYLAVLVLSAAALMVIITGCSRSGEDPLLPPTPSNNVTSSASGNVDRSQTHLWGLYDVYVNVETNEVTAVPNRNAMFTVNVVNILNSKPTDLKFDIHETPVAANYVDIDLDVSITHPFPGLTQYNGYDVRGVFMGDGSGALAYNSDLHYSVIGTDQFMLPSPKTKHGGPDGYTRWYNPAEFSGDGIQLFQYTKGEFASQSYTGSATLCPYKYFADELGATDDLFTFLKNNSSKHGGFSAGSTNKRNYYLRFPIPSPNVRFEYAIIANWKGEHPQDHPANAPEPVACSVYVTPDIYYVDPDDKGGELRLDISLFDWDSQVSNGVVDDYRIAVESNVLSAPHIFTDPEMTPISGGNYFSTFHVEVPADNVTGTGTYEFWIIAEDKYSDYSNPYDVPNIAEDEPITACFRYDFYVGSSSTVADDIICSVEIDPDSPIMPFDGWGAFGFDASDSMNLDGDPITFEWDFNNDGVFGDPYEAGTPDHPIKVFDFVNEDQVCVRLSDWEGHEATCCVPVDIIGHPLKNIHLRDNAEARDIAIDHSNGDLLVLYSDQSVYKYPRSQFYQTGSQLATPWTPDMYFIDVTGAGYFVCGGLYSGGYPTSQGFDPSGVQVYQYGHGGPATLLDAFAMGPNGEYSNDMGISAGRIYPPGPPNYYEVICYHSPDECWWPVYQHNYTIPVGENYSGPDKIYYDYIRGLETDQDSVHVWFLESPDYYATRMLLYGSAWWDAWIKYGDAYFGTGAKTDGDDSWNDAKDITRDNQNRYFVLDLLSTGAPRVKMWTVDGDITTSAGGFGDSTTISGEPRRIEGGDFDGNIVVLHGGSPADMISVFLPVEMPG